jgi:hypothetical protein
MTVAGSVTTVSYDLLITCPLNTTATLVIQFERSSDGGTTWTTFDDATLVGGPIIKGTNAGQQATNEVSGEIDNLNDGDELRIVGTPSAPTTATSTFANHATTITVANASGIAQGQHVSGAGIANGTTVSSVSGTAVTLSAQTNHAETSTSVTFTDVWTITASITQS